MKHIIALLMFASVANAQVIKTVDEFTGETRYTGEAVEITNTGAHTSRGVTLRTSDGQTYILINTKHDSWVHLKDDIVNAIHGQERVIYPITMLKVDSDVSSGYSSVIVSESIALRITNHNIRHPLRVRIGTVIYDIPESMLAEIKEMGRIPK